MNVHKGLASTLMVLAAVVAPAVSLAGNFGNIADRIEIEQLCARYALALDSGDADAVGVLFTADAVFDVAGTPFKGREKIQDFARGLRATFKLDSRPPADDLGRRFTPMRHVISNLVLDVNGNTATADSYWTELLSSGREASGAGKPPIVLNAGRYRDLFVKQNGRWLIKERRVIGDLFEQLPAELASRIFHAPFPDNSGPTRQSP
jgi:ketosteroid isomerase-like protein